MGLCHAPALQRFGDALGAGSGSRSGGYNNSPRSVDVTTLRYRVGALSHATWQASSAEEVATSLITSVKSFAEEKKIFLEPYH